MAYLNSVLVPANTPTKIYNGGATTGVAKLKVGSSGGIGLTNSVTVNTDGYVENGYWTTGYEEITPNVLGLAGAIPALWYVHNNTFQDVYAWIWVP